MASSIHSRSADQWQSADQQRLFGIAKQGASDIRRNLVLAGHSLLAMVKRRKEPPSDRLLIWVRRLGERKNRNVAAVAVAAKLTPCWPPEPTGINRPDT